MGMGFCCLLQRALSRGGVEWGVVGVTMPWLRGRKRKGSWTSRTVGKQSLCLPGDLCYQSGCLQQTGNLATMSCFGQTKSLLTVYGYLASVDLERV